MPIDVNPTGSRGFAGLIARRWISAARCLTERVDDPGAPIAPSLQDQRTKQGNGHENGGTIPCAYVWVTLPQKQPESTGQFNVYFLPLRLLGPSLPEASPPLVSTSLVTAPLFFVFFKWCSGIHSSSYPPELVAATATGAPTSEGAANLGFLDLGKSERKVK